MSQKNELLFKNVKILGASNPIKKGWLLTRDNQIKAFGEGNPPHPKYEGVVTIDGDGALLLPGFIDLHTHGALGSDFVFGSHENIQHMSAFFASHGVTGFLATTYSASPSEITNAMSTIRSCLGSEPGARILGVHLEGPWINVSRAGAQAPSRIRTADLEEVTPYLDSGLVRLVAVAPEIAENQWLIGACRERGITVSAGHTDATYAEMQQAVQMGVTQVTHCFNAMHGLHHREPGVAGAALSLSELRCELIADNIHVHPALMKILVNSKTPAGVILITDSISAAGMPDGFYSIEGHQVILKDGSARLGDGTLAGSALTMDKALQNLVTASGRSIDEVWQCSSLNAAEAIGVATHKGRIEASYDADLVLLDSNLHVMTTVVKGNVVFNDR